MQNRFSLTLREPLDVVLVVASVIFFVFPWSVLYLWVPVSVQHMLFTLYLLDIAMSCVCLIALVFQIVRQTKKNIWLLLALVPAGYWPAFLVFYLYLGCSFHIVSDCP
jgi:hypothetical protein